MTTTGSNARPEWPLAVVVGAGGMGMAVARRLGQTHRLLLADRDGAHLDRQRENLASEGHDVTAAVCDVTLASDIATLAAQARDLGPVKALANVVGLSPSMGDFATIMTVNLVGAAAVGRVMADVLAPGGAAVFIASSAGQMGPVAPELLAVLDDPSAPDLVQRLATSLGADATPAQAYTLSKKGLCRMCQHAAPAWGRKGLRIVSLSPGLIATPQGAREFTKSAGKARLLEATPLGREGTMLEIAGVVEFLVSDRASFISGTDILVDGGLIGALGTRPLT